MDIIPLDLIPIIFDYIQKITDKRQFLKTCKIYNDITKNMIKNAGNKFIIDNKVDINNYYKFINSNKENKYCVEKFTIELCQDLYFDMIPNSYLNGNNKIIMEILASHNNIELLQVAIDNGCKLTKYLSSLAALYGHLDTLKFIMDLNMVLIDKNICSNAALNGHLDVLKWAKENGCYLDAKTCKFSAKYGNLNILKWLRENGCDWDSYTCAYAAEYGHLDILKWLRENGCEWDNHTCNSAARGGHLNILIWARENGCGWDSDVTSWAAIAGHIDILIWAKENGCEMSSHINDYATSNGHLNIIQWMFQNNYGNTDDICIKAVINGHLDVFKWARNNSCKYDKFACLFAAKSSTEKRNGTMFRNFIVMANDSTAEERNEVVEWAKKNGFMDLL